MRRFEEKEMNGNERRMHRPDMFERPLRPHGDFERPCHSRGERPHFDENDLEGMFMACARRMRFDKHRRFGLSQDRIIALLDENGGTLAQKSLQKLLDVKPGSISEILSKMEEKGLIERIRDEEDKRACLIKLNANVTKEEKKDSFFDVLNDEEKEQMKSLLKKVLDSKKESTQDDAQE